MNRDAEIFGDLLHSPEGERAALLDRECGDDPTRRARLEALLEGYAVAGTFLEDGPGRAQRFPREEKPGDVIGRYQLLKKIGEGGCGTVYLAEQKIPVQRRVALKVIKLGMDTRAVIARFEAERQALALMDHPDVARVFDAGATEAGRPFFVMELVDGLPITRFCDAHRLALAARLELFARVCLALQHAHQKGIIHRDVKPSNILVALRDDVPMPKVIDFGIAKATQDRLTEQTFLTGAGQFVGTPAYMSPEQADGRHADIDTRSDVYSLGVLLYELLAGRLPFDPRSLAQTGVDELRRIIREVEPARPSARLAALSPSEQATIASHRATRARPLGAALQGDLDWIVMRCLEKEPERRYGSARELADDVGRHLRHEPVVARPPSVWYRAERFVARNRLACASAAAIALALVGGTIVSVRQAVRATNAERVAQAERDVARAANQAETRARSEAQRRQEQAEGLLTFMLGDVHNELKKIGRTEVLLTVGEQAEAYFAAVEPRALSDIELARQAKALTQIGQVRLDRLLYPEASAAFTAAYQRAEALTARHPQSADILFERAQAEYWIGFVALRRGEFAVVREWFTRYRDSAIRLGAIEGQTRRAQTELSYAYNNLAMLELEAGNLVSARSGFLAQRAGVETMLARNPGDSQLRSRMAESAFWLGLIAERGGDFSEALSRFAETASRYEELVAAEPKVARWRMRLEESVAFIGSVHGLLGRRAEATAAYARAQGMLSELVVLDPQNRQWQVHLENLRIEQAALLLAGGENVAAAPSVGAARVKLEALLKAEPSSRVLTRCLAFAWRLESSLLLAARRLDEADAAIDRAINLVETLMKEARADARVVGEAAQTNLLAGRIALARGQPEHAREHWRRALDVVTPRLENSDDWRLLDPAAQALVLLEKPDEARPLTERLRRFGYHPLDPLAAQILTAAPLPASGTQKQ